MSELFLVSVKDIDKKKGKVDFHLTIINPDQKSFYNTKSFALMLLLDTISLSNAKSTTITDEIPINDIEGLNFDLIKKKEAKIIKKVDVHDIVNFPIDPTIKDLPEDKYLRFWADKKSLPQCIVTVLVKDGNYLSHLSPGQSWKSSAYNII